MGSWLYVPASQQTLMLQKSHDSKTAGHFGFVKTPHQVKRQFWWPHMKKNIEHYVANYPVCTSVERRPEKTLVLLQPVASPTAL